MKKINLTIFTLASLINPTFAYADHVTGKDHSTNLGEEYAFGIIKDLGSGSSALIAPMFEIAAVGVVFYLLIGAYKFITSAGDKNAVASARNMITHAIIGFILLMLLFLIIQFIPEFFGLVGFKLINGGPIN